MKPDEPAIAADEHVGRYGWLQVPASTRYRQQYRVWVAIPVDPVARSAFKLCPGLLKRHEYPLEVVLTAVPFQGDSDDSTQTDRPQRSG